MAYYQYPYFSSPVISVSYFPPSPFPTFPQVQLPYYSPTTSYASIVEADEEPRLCRERRSSYIPPLHSSGYTRRTGGYADLPYRKKKKKCNISFPSFRLPCKEGSRRSWNPQLHASLSRACRNISWDITRPPKDHKDFRYSQYALYEPATEPAVRELTVLYELGPWKMKIKAGRSDIVTVADVLEAIHELFQEHLKRREWKDLKHFGLQRRTYSNACLNLREQPPKYHISGYPKRCDVLGGKTRFRGLECTENPSVWCIVLDYSGEY
ncbi:hypothetical protein M422DRAFT_782926 [Sphaerobolus stellatus SS14]|uniref:DUF6699 domain-containing protein n=1 Tax=Sphaerobolus stellatus (strain SS14) TaxID=990650 RepID=A0A0C9VAD1_SPHS4|nr:hypothetical protein M422DRAFT_782926 [Sphaerobolus stellatus SS14]